jgi:undecaprenyl-diphosphatase
MEFLHAIVLGLVEALTEFLPVSSTGHLILTSHLFGLENNEFNKAFEVVIQAGAILAVIVYYHKLLRLRVQHVLRGDRAAIDFFLKIFVAFFPAALMGLLFHKKIKALLFGPLPVVIALFIGGLAMVLIERKLRGRSASKHSLDELTYKDALIVGCAQTLSLWPGISRAMTTLLGSRMRGLAPSLCAEFSFLLAIPIILAATFYDLYKMGPALWENAEQLKLLAVGIGVSFVAALFVIHWFLGFLKKHSLEVFGWYRILVAAAYAYFLL